MRLPPEHAPAELAEEFLRQPNLFITPKEAAYRLRIHPATVRWLARRGDLASIRTGRPIWVYVPSITQLLERTNS